MAKRFTAEEQSQARRLRAEGKKLEDIAKVMGRSLGGVWVQETQSDSTSVSTATSATSRRSSSRQSMMQPSAKPR